MFGRSRLKGRRGKRGGGPEIWARALRLAGFTAGAAFIVTLPVQSAASGLGGAAAPLLFVIVTLGVASDMIGVAATRAEETPFVARAAKKRPGAREGLDLVRHADLVATIASDVVGDLAGTISGAMLAVVLLGMSGVWTTSAPLRTAVGVAILTGMTIGAKAIAKAYAVRNADAIVQRVGYVVYLLKKLAPKRPRRERRAGS